MGGGCGPHAHWNYYLGRLKGFGEWTPFPSKCTKKPETALSICFKNLPFLLDQTRFLRVGFPTPTDASQKPLLPLGGLPKASLFWAVAPHLGPRLAEKGELSEGLEIASSSCGWARRDRGSECAWPHGGFTTFDAHQDHRSLLWVVAIISGPYFLSFL